MLKHQNVPWRTVSHGTLRFFCLCVQETKRFSLTTTRRQKNENYKTTKLLFKVLNIPLTYFVKCRRLSWSGIPRPISKFTKKEIKFRRCLFTFPIKCEIMHFYSVVVQNKKYTNKCDARAKLLFCLLNLLFFPRSRCPPYRRIDVNCQNWPIIGYRVFPLTWPAPMQIYWNRRKSLHKKIVQLPQDWFGTPTWLPFHCFETPTWPPWRDVKTLCTRSWLIRMRFWKQWALSIRPKRPDWIFGNFQ